jgi:hypothetical protein
VGINVKGRVVNVKMEDCTNNVMRLVVVYWCVNTSVRKNVQIVLLVKKYVEIDVNTTTVENNAAMNAHHVLRIANGSANITNAT